MKANSQNKIKYYSQQVIQLAAMFVFICSKQPVDLFKLFNKRPDVQFSIYQYPNFFHAERKYNLMHNAYLLRKKLGDKKLAQLDEDDILNPQETLRREKLGIDIDYLVKRLGQGSDDGSYSHNSNAQEMEGSFDFQ